MIVDWEEYRIPSSPKKRRKGEQEKGKEEERGVGERVKKLGYQGLTEKLTGGGLNLYILHMLTQPCPTLCHHKDCNLPGLSPWNFPGKNTGVGCPFLLQGIFLTQDWTRVSWVSYVGRWILYQLSHQGRKTLLKNRHVCWPIWSDLSCFKVNSLTQSFLYIRWVFLSLVGVFEIDLTSTYSIEQEYRICPSS